MRNKTGSLCLALLLLISIWIPGAAAEVPTIEVTVPTEPVMAGESFDVKVSLRDNPGFYAIQFTLFFDHAAMKCSEIEYGPLLDGVMTAKNAEWPAGARIAGATLDGSFEDGTIAVFRMEALTSVSPDSIYLSEALLSGEDNDFPVSVEMLGGSGSSVPPESEPGTGTSPDDSSDPVAPVSDGEGGTGSIGGGEDANTSIGSGDAGSSGSGDASSAGDGDTSSAGDGEKKASPGGSNSVNAQDPGEKNTEQESVPPAVESGIDFPDIQNHWGREAILKAAKLGLFKGYEDGTFGPNDPVTRVQLVTVLYRLSGSPEVTEDAPFTDIAREIPEFRAAVSWAYANGYVNGRTETTFDPRTGISRQETLTILFRLSGGQSGMEAMFTSIYDETYTDSEQIASWAKKAIYWGVYNEIIRGTSEVTIDPTGTTTRAQMATLLVNYIEEMMND